MRYEPDYTVVIDAALNKNTPYIPLYEHNVCSGFFDTATGHRKQRFVGRGCVR